MPKVSRWCAWVCLVLVVASGWHAGARAKVEIAFYARESSGREFPHAFVAIRGQLDSTGEKIDQVLGFTSRRLSPEILLHPVPGAVIDESPQSLAQGRQYFRLSLSDARFRAVDRVVRRWRHRKQPSYDLDRSNCLHFVGELALAAGLKVPSGPSFYKRPRDFLAAVKALNRGV